MKTACRLLRESASHSALVYCENRHEVFVRPSETQCCNTLGSTSEVKCKGFFACFGFFVQFRWTQSAVARSYQASGEGPISAGVGPGISKPFKDAPNSQGVCHLLVLLVLLKLHQ
jgi:hypothetical protein